MKLSKAEKKRIKKEQHFKKLEDSFRDSAERTEPEYTFSELLMILRANFSFILLLAVIIFTVYFYSLFGKFLTADDIPGFVNNPAIRDFGAQMKSLMLTSMIYTSIYHIFGTSAFALHLHSVFLHLITTVLVFIFSYLLFGKKVSFVSSLLFAIHPVNTEAVSWISGFGYLYIGLSSLIVLILFTLYRKSGTRKYLYWSYFSFLLQLVFVRSPWILTVPFIITVLDQMILEKRINKNLLIKEIPFWLIGVLSGSFYYLKMANQRVSDLQTVYGFNYQESAPLLKRLPYTIFTSLKVMIFPKDLSFFHEGEYISIPYYIFMILISVTAVSLIFILWKKHRTISGLIALIFVSILPTFSPVQVAFFTAERYLYTGSVFLCLILAIGIVKIQNKWPDKKWVNFSLIILLLVFSLRTSIRTNDWHSSKNLWLATSKTAPNSARVFNNLGDAYATEGDLNASIRSFKKAIELQPNYVDAIHNLGNTYLQAGMYKEAKEEFNLALSLDHNYEGATRAKQVLSVLQERNL